MCVSLLIQDVYRADTKEEYTDSPDIGPQYVVKQL